MCGRYFVAITEKELRDAVLEAMDNMNRGQVQIRMDKSSFKLMEAIEGHVKPTQLLIGESPPAGVEICPTDIVPAMTRKSGYLPMQWGFRKWGDQKGVTINARSETASTSAYFGYAKHRCIVPASFYYEWENTNGISGRASKIKHEFHVPDRPVMYMAGLCKMEKDESLPRVVILTKKASPSVEGIHDRMPVIIPDHAIDWWLDNGSMQEAVEELRVV